MIKAQTLKITVDPLVFEYDGAVQINLPRYNNGICDVEYFIDFDENGNVEVGAIGPGPGGYIDVSYTASYGEIVIHDFIGGSYMMQGRGGDKWYLDGRLLNRDGHSYVQLSWSHHLEIKKDIR